MLVAPALLHGALQTVAPTKRLPEGESEPSSAAQEGIEATLSNICSIVLGSSEPPATTPRGMLTSVRWNSRASEQPGTAR
jgi:hypothetical protein